MNMKCFLLFGAALAAVTLPAAFSAEVPKAPVPVSPFIKVVYGYADAMLKHGRDKSGLFFSALDRNTLTPLANWPAAPKGVRGADRVGTNSAVLAGSNPYHDENLLRLLSTLSDLSAKPHYRAAADAELKWFVENADLAVPDQFRPWMLWDRCFELTPGASKQTMARLAQQEIASGAVVQRQAGFTIRALAIAYAQTKDEQFLRAITRWLDRQETNAARDFTPSLAIDCDAAAQRVPEPLASRLRSTAVRQDAQFCSLPHDLKGTTGFVADEPGTREKPFSPATSRWKARYDTRTTAQIGMMCVSRYDNTGNVGYRKLLFAAADAFLDSLPAEDEDAWPATFGHAISLEIAAWRHSADWKYMERARKLGNIAVEKFWGTNALPRASLKSDHYESITGADTLSLALLELHLQILHITAVRCPANTMDR
jgi:hypothetical protein